MSDTVLALIKFVQENKELLAGKPVLIDRIQNVLRKADPGDEDADWENQGFSVIEGDDDEVDPETAKWLEEAEAKQKAKEASIDSSPDLQQEIADHQGRGFNENESKYFADATHVPQDFDLAMKGQLDKTIDSPAMWKLFAEHSGDAIREHTRKEQERAELEKNPMRYAAGQAAIASREAHKDFDDNFHAHISDESMKGLSAREIHDKMNAFHDAHESDDHADKMVEAGVKASEAAQEARKVHATNYQERLKDFMMGGHAQAIGTGGRKVGGADVDEQVGMQHAGAGAVTSADPEAKFAASNPQYIKHLNEEQHSRLKRINAVKAAKVKTEE